MPHRLPAQPKQLTQLILRIQPLPRPQFLPLKPLLHPIHNLHIPGLPNHLHPPLLSLSSQSAPTCTFIYSTCTHIIPRQLIPKTPPLPIHNTSKPLSLIYKLSISILCTFTALSNSAPKRLFITFTISQTHSHVNNLFHFSNTFITTCIYTYYSPYLRLPIPPGDFACRMVRGRAVCVVLLRGCGGGYFLLHLKKWRMFLTSPKCQDYAAPSGLSDEHSRL